MNSAELAEGGLEGSAEEGSAAEESSAEVGLTAEGSAMSSFALPYPPPVGPFETPLRRARL